MNIGKVSTAMSTINIKSDIGVAVLNKNMEAMEKAGEGIVKIMNSADLERSVNPHIGSNVDILV